MYFEWKYVVCCVAHTGVAVLRAVHDAPRCLNITDGQVVVCRFMLRGGLCTLKYIICPNIPVDSVNEQYLLTNNYHHQQFV
jgi:hypothetical protein